MGKERHRQHRRGTSLMYGAVRVGKGDTMEKGKAAWRAPSVGTVQMSGVRGLASEARW